MSPHNPCSRSAASSDPIQLAHRTLSVSPSCVIHPDPAGRRVDVLSRPSQKSIAYFMTIVIKLVESMPAGLGPQLEVNLEYTDERACPRRWDLSLPGCNADADDRNQRYIHPCAGRRSWPGSGLAARLWHNGRHVGSSGERTHRRPHDHRARPPWAGPLVEA